MNEQDILNLIREDEWMMNTLRISEQLHLPDWVIGAGFVRNKVWDHLHGHSREESQMADIDLVYFDPHGNDEEADRALSQKLSKETGLQWEIVNQAYAHTWNSLPPYRSTEDALSQWPETATGIGVNLMKGKLRLVAPHGVEDVVNLVVRKSPRYAGKIEKFNARIEEKRWKERWPRLKVLIE